MHARRPATFCLTTMLMLAASAHAAESALVLDIPAQPLTNALNALASQSGLQIVYETDIALGRSSAALKGTFTPREAVQRLLQGTGLEQRVLNDRAIAIAPAAKTDLPTASNDVAPIRILLAQADVDAGHGEIDAARLPAPAAKAVELEEILVTGSHIRGANPTGSPVTVLTREDIDRTGYTTVQDIMKTVTANTGGGPSEAIQGQGEDNFNAGSSINLRGLGADSTLVLVNGRRQASGGLEGRFTDISSIPATAIERIEILADGASAIYGSDAVAGVVNIVLRKDFEGAETTLRYGSADGDANETVIGQLLGASWDSGHAMLAYQYWERDALASADRAFSADVDKRPIGGDDFSLPFSNPGNILDPATFMPAFAIPRGQDGRSLTPEDLLPGVVNLGNVYEGVDLMPSQRMHTAVLSASQRIGDRLELYADGRFGQRDMTRHNSAVVSYITVPSSNPFFVDPFGGQPSVGMYYSFFDDLGTRSIRGKTETYTGTIGGTLRLAAGWQLELSGSYGDERLRWEADNLVSPADLNLALADPNPATAFNPFGDGSYTNPATLDSIRMRQLERAESEVWSTTAIAQGPLIHLPGGQVKVAIGADYRSEGLDRLSIITPRTSFGDNDLADPGTLERNVTAAFAELQVPVIGPDNRRRGVEDLRLSVAGRYEKYSDFGTTFNPKFGISWSPTTSVDVRASIGTAFKAPNLTEIDEDSVLDPSNASLILVPDPQSSAGQSRILVLTGNNADLHEETATTWTAGVDLHPAAIQGLVVSLTYFDVDYEDRIERAGLGSVYDIFRAEAQWAPIITRNPSPAAVEAICRADGSLSLEECLTNPLPTIVDMRVRNLGVVQVRGLDAQIEYVRPSSIGDWTFRLNGSYLFAFEQAVTKTSPALDLVDTRNGPTSLRLRAGVSWAYRGWSADATVQHQNSYDDQLSSPPREIDAFTTLDLRFAYKLDRSGTWMDGTGVALSIANAFDTDPPFVNNFFGYDAANADPLGRFVSLQITKKW